MVVRKNRSFFLPQTPREFFLLFLLVSISIVFLIFFLVTRTISTPTFSDSLLSPTSTFSVIPTTSSTPPIPPASIPYSPIPTNYNFFVNVYCNYVNRREPCDEGGVQIIEDSPDCKGEYSGSDCPRRASSVQTGRMGEIKLNLTPGDYIVVPLRGSKDFPYLLGEQRRKISITKGQTTTMDIDYSNGTKCLAENTLIYTANGPVAVQNLHEGTKIWTINKNGEKELQPILKTSSATVPNNYAIVRLVLSDGRELYVSPGHPTYNGKTISELKINDKYDKARVIYYDTVQYHSDRTYDLLPAGDTGFYWANGILMGSTLKE